MDEPTSALDPISTGKIEELAVELKKEYTIVMVTHNMQQALRVSDQTAFFLLGEVVEDGPHGKAVLQPPRISAPRITSQGGSADMRRQFDEQLEELAREMISMGAMIESAIDKACDALMRHDVALAKKRDGGRSPH